LVDADSCPVKEEIVEFASRFLVKTLFIASDDHVKHNSLFATWIYVDTGKEAADLYFMNLREGDKTIYFRASGKIYE
jgi:uncharacterized protein YaiI (UPF0178 family)